MNGDMEIVELKNISVAFGDEAVLENISMSIPRGKLVAITGPAGSGKSTLLKIAAGLIYPDSGTVHIDGADILNLPRAALFKLRRDYSFVFQDAALISNLNVYQNITLPLCHHFNLCHDEVETKMVEVLRQFDLEEDKNLRPAQLSFGQRKLVSFARALIMEPKLIFFDEPVAGIDAISREKIINKILTLRENPEISMIMVSHNLDFIKSSADYIALLFNNRLFAYGTRDEILSSRDPFLNKILSIIVDKEAVEAEEVLDVLTGQE
jgi:phospholipid/cholesterol/gamma-HCH transport system ATP-binding protein